MCKVNSICLKISYIYIFFALTAESSCLLRKLLCLLSSFLLNVVSFGVMETHFFIVMTLGAFVSKGGWGDGLQTEIRSSSFLRLDLFKQQTPTDGPEVAAVRVCGCF